MTVNGENTAPRQGQGLATVLGANLAPLNILMRGDAVRAANAKAAAAAKAKQDAEAAKLLQDAKYSQDSSVYFGDSLHEQVYADVEDKLGAIARDATLDNVGKALAYRKIISPIENENAQNKAKSAFLQDRSNEFQKDPELFNNEYIHTSLFNKLKDGDRRRKPSEFDAEAWHREQLADSNSYNELGVVNAATKNLFPVVSQKVTRAGQLGGTHETYEVKGRLVSFDGGGRVVKNGDGTPALNITQNDINALKSDPLFNLKLEQRKSAYEARRTAGEALPAMSEKGHIATMVAPLAKYDTQHEEGLNAQARAESKERTSAEIDEADGTFEAPGTYNATMEGTTSGVAVQPGNTGVNIRNTRPGTTSEGFPHYGKGAAPKTTKKDGTRVDVEAKNLLANGFYQEDGQGHFNYVPNNKTPLAGGYGEPFKMLVDSKSKRIIQLKPGENAEKLIHDGKAEYATHLNMYAHKNENYTADLSKLTNELMQEKNSSGEPKYQSSARAEIVAREALEKGRSRKLVPYAENAVTINNDTRTAKGRGYYRSFEDKVQAENARIRATGPKASPARPSFLGTKTTTTNGATTKKLNSTGKSGGMID